jgi:hypothetical protein
MFKQSMVLLALLVLSCAIADVGWSQSGLVGAWSFDEGTGTVAADGSGNGNDGEIVDATWVEGQLGSALAFEGAGYVDIPAAACASIDTQLTIAFWTYIDFLGDQWPFTFGAFTEPANNEARAFSGHLPWANGILYFDTGGSATSGYDRIEKPVPESDYADMWVHWAFVKDADLGVQSIYRNGVLWHSGAGANRPLGGADVTKFTIACKPSIENFYQGMIDDVQLYNIPLAEEQILAAMQGISLELAGSPSPEDGVVDVLRDAVLTWTPGEFAASHDVYLGTVFDDVANASVDEPLGVWVSQQGGTAYDPEGLLEFGQTYYWRVDEVNAAPDSTVFKGDVWRFTAEPFALPIETVTAAASSANDNMGPENTINGIGLNELDQHSTEGTEMWLSGVGDPNPSIQFAFDQAYKLHDMWVWNSNQLIEAFIGIGAKDVVIEHSMDGIEWVTLDAVPEFAQAPGSPMYMANTITDFGGVLAQYIQITVNAGWGMLPQYGLSAVRFYYIPTLAREPQPADGGMTNSADVTLNWRAGREAASHQVYLGTDADNLVLLGTTDRASYDAGDLDYNSTYYWQIVEVNAAETPASYAGPIWRFATPPFATVDNFDQYDDNCNRIFFAWEDGLGHGGGEDIEDCDVPASNGNGGGSIVGNDMAPFAERTIVAGGSQSLPFNYDNAFGQSEAALTLDAQDWTASGIQSLSLQFYGAEGNSGQLYVKINNTKVAYADDAANIARAEWQAWIIDLSAVGGNLENVTSLTIGVDGASAAGMLYIDEISLYPMAAEYLTPVDPGTANLAGAWSFDEGAGEVVADGSGNGNNGSLNGVGWIPGQMGSALGFDGLSSYVDIPAAAWNTIEQQATVSVWLYVDSSIAQNPVTFAAYQDPTVNNSRVFSTHVLWGNTLYLDTGGDAGGYDRINKAASAGDYADAWIHWAFTKNAEGGEQKIYRNGVLWHSGTGMTRSMTGVTAFTLGSRTDHTAEFWNGSMDEFRLYNKELSVEEILWLAGITSPVVKPF